LAANVATAVTVSRIRFLDGLRGVAIFGVVLFHAYGSHSNYLPFGSRYTSLYPVRFGWSGVELFFLISGFVILMTLEKSSGLRDFATRRWLRLFPAMFIGSLLILAFDRSTGAGPLADRGIVNLLPGFLFLNPSLIHAATRITVDSMDVPFWSLYVEVCFYAVFAISYFWMGSRAAIALIFFLFAISTALAKLTDAYSGVYVLDRLAATFDWIGFVWFGWFASGAIFYVAFCRSDRKTFCLAVCVALISAVSYRPGFNDPTDNVALVIVVAIFAITFLSATIRSLLEWRLLVFLGFVSYPLYLVHCNIILGTSKLLFSHAMPVPDALVPIVPIFAVVVVAWIVARYFEPGMRSMIQAALLSQTRASPIMTKSEKSLAQAVPGPVRSWPHWPRF
jgi:peptidoglycan/LPS O-acetylase OafA/YrhL